MTGAPAGWAAWQAGLMARVDSLARGDVGLDDETRRRAALVVVDDLAAMVAGADEPEVVRLSGHAAKAGPGTDALHVTGLRSSRSWAACVNAVAANWNELDEGYRPATCHGGLYALPAAMAETQASGGTVGDLLRAVVAGYEVATAYARVLPPERPLLLHPHATLSPIGAAAAVAFARGHDGPGVPAAVAVAATLAAVGPFVHATDGVMARNGWVGHGAMAGFTAVEMAQAGIGADESAAFTVLHQCLGYPVNEGEFDNPWTRWAIHDGYHKSYACCQYAHSAVEASLELARGPLAGVVPERITSIVVSTHPLAMPLDDISPTTALGGKFSVPHTVAAVLARRSAAPSVFSGELLNDPAIARLRSLVEVEAYEGSLKPPFDRPARVRVTLDSGESHVAECRSAEGGPDRPLMDGDVLAKAELLTARTRPEFARVAAALVNGALDDDAPWAEALEGMWAS